MSAPLSSPRQLTSRTLERPAPQEVRVADLRFTLPETESFLNGVSGLDLSACDVEALGQRTDGWVAALQLAAQSLQGREQPSTFISRFAGTSSTTSLTRRSPTWTVTFGNSCSARATSGPGSRRLERRI
jgi:ATP/maltotriose-dependent transcriptional regulator MalT